MSMTNAQQISHAFQKSVQGELRKRLNDELAASSALASLVGAAVQASRGAGLPSWTTALEAAQRAEVLQSGQLRNAVGRGGGERRQRVFTAFWRYRSFLSMFKKKNES